MDQYIYLTDDLKPYFSSNSPAEYEDQTPVIVVHTDNEDDMRLLLNIIFPGDKR